MHLPCSFHVPLTISIRGKSTCGEWSRTVGTEREFRGQRDRGNSPVKSIQIKAILNSQFEMQFEMF